MASAPAVQLTQTSRSPEPRLGVILVDPQHCPSVKAAAGQQFVDWITGEAGQQAIADYQLKGQQLFFPNAGQGHS